MRIAGVAGAFTRGADDVDIGEKLGIQRDLTSPIAL